jgi:hypothetical protein
MTQTRSPWEAFNPEMPHTAGGYYPALFFGELAALSRDFLPQMTQAYYIRSAGYVVACGSQLEATACLSVAAVQVVECPIFACLSRRPADGDPLLPQPHWFLQALLKSTPLVHL